MKEYSMEGAMSVAERAAKDIEQFLRKDVSTVEVINVEDDETYREKDIDLIWTYNKNGVTKTVTIEIKGDTYYRTGNYFLETISNDQKNTPGCFMYTEADYIYYYFVDERELHILPMPKTREWFIDNINRFKARATSTTINGKFVYRTIGKLVDRKTLQQEVQGVKVLKI